MSQHDFNIANQGFPSFRTDLNNALVALATTSSGTAEPATTYANQLWYETDTNILHIRNEANSAWLDLMVINQTTGSPSFMAGNVGIGTDTAEAPLHVVGGEVIIEEANDGGSTAPVLIMRRTSTTPADDDYIGSITFSGVNDTLADQTYARILSRALDVTSGTEDGALIFWTTGAGTSAERARIDASGNLLVGMTSSNAATVGCRVLPIGTITATRDDGDPAVINRLTTDGTLIDLRKNTVSVGIIGVNSTRPYLAGASSGIAVGGVNGAIFPTDAGGTLADNLYDVGSSSVRWDDIYATNNVIQTSDRNEKQDIEELSEAERRVAVACKGLMRKYRWKDAVAEKGDDARIHFGIIAQDLQAAFAAEGLDAGRYAMFIHSTWTDEETGEERSRMGVRYTELLAFMIAAL